MGAVWIRRVALGAVALATVISLVVVDDVELVAVGVAVTAVGALAVSGAVVLAAALGGRRRPAKATVATVVCVAFALWAPVPIDWNDRCYGNGVTALWATPVAGQLYDATGIAGAAYDSRVERCL